MDAIFFDNTTIAEVFLSITLWIVLIASIDEET
jgi:hypothetical protein